MGRFTSRVINGKTWTNVTPKDLPEGGRVQYIVPSPHRKGSAYSCGLSLDCSVITNRTFIAPTPPIMARTWNSPDRR
jgi:hypothetical protein